MGHIARIVFSALNPVARRQKNQNRSDMRTLGKRLLAVRSHIQQKIPQTRGVALFIAMTGTRYVLQQLPVIAGILAHGLEPVIILPSKAAREELYLYQSCGLRRFAYWDDFSPNDETGDILEQLQFCKDQDDVLVLRWRDLAIGKYVVSTLMRRLRSGHIDLSLPLVRRHMEVALRRCLDHASASLAILDRWNPELVVFVDRGYTPEGPLFEACIARNIKPITFNAAHRDNALILKRYESNNSNVHPASLSEETWHSLQQMKWTDLHWQALRGEIEHCYQSGQWYGEVATQHNTQIVTREQLLAQLTLDPGKKTVLLFPHIFWDATFFWGTDVFRDYEEWFRESVKAAWDNNRVNWIIKIHPANVVKNIRDGTTEEYSEMRVLNEFGAIPSHIRILPADTPISTLSVFSVGDVCLTVRGTVGIEAAALGLTVITAGTGRYDGLGFTHDVQTKNDYTNLLTNIENLPRPSSRQIEMARRYGYGAFLVRPLEITSIPFKYAKSREASLQVSISQQAEDDLMSCEDIRAISSWLASGKQDICGSKSIE